MTELLIALVAPLIPQIAIHIMEKKRKTNMLGVRLDDDLQRAFDAACKTARMDASGVVRACIQAFVDEVREKGGVFSPFAITSAGGKKTASDSASVAALAPHRLNENPPDEATPPLPFKPRVTRTRAALRKMQTPEKRKP